jgi:hypothetical protein
VGDRDGRELTMGCGCGKGAKKATVEYEVTTRDGKVQRAASMPEVRRMLTLGGGGTYRAVSAETRAV